MINLLPLRYKEKIRAEQGFRLIMILGFMLVVVFLALTIFLLVIQISLRTERASQATKLSLFQERENTTLEHITAWNTQLANIDSFKKDRRPVKAVFDELHKEIPPTLSLLSFSYTPSFEAEKGDEIIHNPAALAATGKAPTREQLLAFKDALEANPFFAEVVFPPSNWVKPTNITFSFQVKLKEQP